MGARAVPETNHSSCQALLGATFVVYWRSGELFPATGIRIATTDRRYRVIDVAVFRDRPEYPMPQRPPFIAIEIISPSDTLSGLLEKLTEYETIGVPHIWVANPGRHTFTIFRNGSLIETSAFELPEFGLRITPAQVFA